MDKDEAYNLYHYAGQFMRQAIKKGFKFIETGRGIYIEIPIKPTKQVPIDNAHVGEIVNPNLLIVYTSKCGKFGSEPYVQAVSKLQKLATDFKF